MVYDVEILSGNVTLSEEIIECDVPVTELNKSGIIEKEVEENLPCISNEEQMPEHCEIRSIEAVNLYKDESFKEPEQKVGQNVEKVRILSK